MQTTIFKRSLIASAIIFALALIAPVVASAQQPARAQEAQQQAQTRQETPPANVEERREAANTKLAGAKLKACENRQKAITNIMSRIADRGQKQLELFTTIAERTEAFYADKGKTLANYDELVADVEAKKAAAQTAVDAVESNSTTFDCSNENPKAAIDSFKESLKGQIEALNAYKKSVKNLIVGVKSVQSTTSSSENGAE